jgi:IS5 family transposase
MAVINAGLAPQGLMLKTGTVVDATIIAAPSSTKNKDGERDPEMHQTKKSNQWHFGMKAHIGGDAESGVVHTVVGTAANVNDVTQTTQLLHEQEADVFADAGYQGVHNREEAQGLAVQWHIALRPGKIELVEKIKASIRAKVEHPFRLIKQQFGHAKVRYRGLAKNTARLQADVCARQPVDGTQGDLAGSAGMSAPAARQRALPRAKTVPQTRRSSEKSAPTCASRNLKANPCGHSLGGWGFADLP